MTDTKTIVLSQGKYRGVENRPERKETIVDNDDYDFLMQWKWYYSNTGYPTRDEIISYKNPRIVKKIPMHRIIMKASDKDLVDHINFNPLDNRKENLRICTYSQNSMNRKKQKKKTSSIYKGVWVEKRGKYVRYRAQIGKDYKKISLGEFRNEVEAAKTYNAAALKYHGEFAILNEIPT